jgi:hypothetical protein
MKPTCVAAVFAFLAASSVSAFAGTINVPGDSATIRGAIDLALDGDTVVVAAGTYAEFLFLDQRNNLTIQATGVVILAPKSKVKGPPAAITLSSCQNITFDGFTISKAPADGVFIATCLSVTISHCTVDRAKGFGIRSLGGQDVTIADCTVTGSGKKKGGISLSAGPGLTTTRGHVQRCTVSKTGGPGIIVHGPNALVEDCTVTKAKQAGIELDRAGGSDNGAVRRCTVTGSGDIGIVASGFVSIIEFNTVNGSASYGIATVEDANLATASAVIDDNTVTKTKKKDGILAGASCNVDRNTVTSAHGDGIRIIETGVELRDNIVTKSGAVGVHLLGSGHDVTGNNASANKKADLWDQSTGTTFTANTFVKVKL